MKAGGVKSAKKQLTDLGSKKEDDPKKSLEVASDVIIDEATGIIYSNSGLKKIQNHEALGMIGGVPVRTTEYPFVETRYALGALPRLNIRTRSIEIGDHELSGDQLSRLYLQLSNHKQSWSKEMTKDAVETIADLNAYDPIAVYLHNTNPKEALADDEWNNLDQFLFGIDDPVARVFMKRYLVAAVKRPCQPSCEYRQIPVLIGEQNIGKTKFLNCRVQKLYT